jgi:tetratricopeptide (TPR) repeat protein
VKALLGWAALLTMASTCLSAEVPGIVVFQSNDKKAIVEAAKKIKTGPEAKNVPKEARFDPIRFEYGLTPLPVTELTAAEIEQDGRLTPVAWALTDVIFRTAVGERLISGSSEWPKQEAMPKLRVGYALEVAAFLYENEVWTSAALYKGTKEIWRDEIRTWQSQIQTEFDSENARRSIARTWVQVLAGGPLKDLPKRRRAATPAPLPGVALQNDPTPPPSPAETKQILIEAMRLLSAKKHAEAINFLRDAVDAQPLDPERREGLIEALLQIGEYELAADEARRAAKLAPEKIGFWVAAARAWMEAGRGDQAEQDLNEAVSRQPESPETRLLLAEVQILAGRPLLSAEHLSHVLSQLPTAYAYRMRAFAHGAQGLGDAAMRDVSAATQAETAETPAQALRRQRLCVRAGLTLAEAWATQTRDLIPRIRVGQDKDQTRAEWERLRACAESLDSLMAGVPWPEAHRGSSEKLRLALKLLLLSATDLRGSLDRPDEDALTEATINLGEAFRAIRAGQEDLAREIG